MDTKLKKNLIWWIKLLLIIRKKTRLIRFVYIVVKKWNWRNIVVFIW